MAVLEDIAAYVDTQTALTLGTDLFIGELPADPDAATVLLEYGGGPVRYTLGEKRPAMEEYSVQIVSRDTTYQTARARAQTVYQAIAEFTTQVINSTRYLSIEPKQPPFPLAWDDNDRYRFVFNVEVQREYY